MNLKTERLVLREFIDDDWSSVFAYEQNPLYQRYYEWTEPTPEKARKWVKMFIDNQLENPRTKFQLAITLRSTGELIGNCGIRLKSAGAHEADIGYELDPQYWGQGYASEAVRAIVQFGFSELHLHRVWAWCVADNVGSARVLEKLGMLQEGRLRENEYYNGRYWDTLVYAILEDEWKANQHA